MNVKVVIGANYGDEGKGQMADYFCHHAISQNENCIVVCSNGGSQRGHTVCTPDGKRHIFHHFGSGTLVGADTYLSEDYILNPIIFKREYKELEELGIEPKVYVHPKCIWSTPYDMFINQIVEEYRGENRHGSCGYGIWETVVRYQTVYTTALNSSKLKSFLGALRNTYVIDRLNELGVHNISEQWRNLIFSDDLINHFLGDVEFFLQHVTICDNTVLNKYQNIVFENGQGLLLDQNMEPKEHTTPSNTGLKNPKKIIEKLNCNVEVCYVTRTYLTRHGAGPFPHECKKEEINTFIKEKTNVPNTFQGTLRYGKINIKELLDRIQKDFADNIYKLSLSITHINECSDFSHEVSGFDKVYVSDGTDRDSIRDCDYN